VKGDGQKNGTKKGGASLTLGDLRRIAVFRDLSDDELGRVLEKCEARVLRPRVHIAIDTEFSNRVFFVLRGSCKTLAIAPNGTSVTMNKLVEGDSFGLPAAMLGRGSGFRTTRLISDQSTTIVTIRHSDYRLLTENCRALAVETCRTVCAAQLELVTRFYELAALDVRGRLLAELVRVAHGAEREDGRLILRSAPTHAELGAQISAAREAVTRQLMELERDGVISAARRKIIIEDYDRLRQLDEATAGRRQFLDGDGKTD
jgi:CRP-like cAMP-binding protein